MAFTPTEAHDRVPEHNKRVDFDELDKQLATNIDSNLESWFSNKPIKLAGQWFKIGNNGSLSVNMHDGHWHSHESEDKGQGLLSLYAWHYSVDINQASEDLSDASKVVNFRQSRAPIKREKEVNQWEHSIEPPITTPESHFDLGLADKVYRYRTRDGHPIGAVLRWNATPERGKEIRPVSWIQLQGKESPEWKWCGFANPRPLYRGERIKKESDKPIVIVEGEKCVDALESILPDHIILTWCGGAGQIGSADFAGLEDRDITIWPDNDEPGIKAANVIRDALPHAKIVSLPSDAPEKWDVSDAITGGLDATDLLKILGDVENDGLFVDLEAVFDSDMEPERPTIAASDSGDCILYAGRINEIHGEPSVGKTNINIAIMACELRMGQKVMFIDPEDNPHGIMRRMAAFGISRELILANLYYLHDPTPEDLLAAHRWADRNNPSLVTLDGVAEMITGCKYKEDSSADVLEFFKIYIRPFVACGAAVNLSDHVVKSSEGRGLWSRGSGAKMGRYDGVSYHVTLTSPYSPSQKGSVKFTIAKDRNGGIGAKGEDIFMAFFEPNGQGQTDVSIRRLKERDSISEIKWKQLEGMHLTLSGISTGTTATDIARKCVFKPDIPASERNGIRDQLVKMGLIEKRQHGKEKRYYPTGKPFSSCE